jgi:hypothetical protein
MAQTIERNDIFDLAYRFVTETSENIFLTGKAGTGKTTFLKYLRDNAPKNIVIAAPTGVAAINAGGVTLHSLFQLPFGPFIPTKINKDELLSKIRQNRQKQNLLRKMELLVIDEISMVRCDVMDAIDTILRSVRRTYDVPFGGVQLLCIGDLFQLPPVARNEEWNMLSEYYPSPFFFDSHAIKEQTPLLLELNKIYRQKEDSFVRLLNKVRTNTMDADDFEDLHMQYKPGYYASADEKYITLTSHNNQADNINQTQINRLSTPPFTYNAVIENDFPESMYPAESSLVLREGAQVMFLKNDVVGKRYFNGKIGVVKSLQKEKIIVDCDGEEIYVGLETWENSRYTLNRGDGKLEQETLGTFSQYPLRLAWAITIHKSQGLTFEKVMIDAAAAFSSGQVYVALSRCTSLQGIVLLSKIPTTAITSNDAVVKGQQSLHPKGNLAERFAGARIGFTQQLLENIFSFIEVEDACLQLLYSIKQNADKLNDTAVGWIDKLQLYFATDKNVGLKFNGQVSLLMKDEGVVENNAALQKRISDAANHFLPRLEAYAKELQQHPLVTDHKEVAVLINEQLNALALALYNGIYYLQYCQQPFSVTNYLKHKLKYILPKFTLTCYAAAQKTSAINSDINNPELYSTLKRWRDMACADENLAVYLVANSETLKALCTYLPLTKKDLLQITGFGKAKVEKYGDEVLGAIESYCQQHNIETNMGALAPKAKKEKVADNPIVKTDTKTTSFNLFKAGKTLAEIAAERKLAIGTIEGHLVPFVVSGEIHVDDLVSKQKQQLIKDAINIHGQLSHKTLIENLPNDISYADIKMTLAALTS